MSATIWSGGITSSLKKAPKSLIFLLRSPSQGLPVISQNLVRTRSLFYGPARNSGHWKKETPLGGQTELYVYEPESETLWPDPKLGVLNVIDSKFSLPGHVGIAQSGLVAANEIVDSNEKVDQETPKPNLSHQSDLLRRPTNTENQAQILYTANDYIQYTKEAENVVCSNLLDEFPRLRGMSNFICEVHEAPRLLKKELEQMFLGKEVFTGSVSVITMAQKTEHDMSVWSNAMEEERESMTEHFFVAAKEICARLKSEGHWADFIDPSSGQPYFSPHTPNTMFETDEKYRLLGFRIEDLGCCKVICHREYGRKVFIGTILTNAHVSTGVIDEVFFDLKLALSSSQPTVT